MTHLHTHSTRTALAAALIVASAAAAQTPRPAIGDTARPIDLQTSDGENRTLAHLGGSKTALIVFFRGTW